MVYQGIFYDFLSSDRIPRFKNESLSGLAALPGPILRNLIILSLLSPSGQLFEIVLMTVI